jgi:hypothetical protein
MSFHRSALDTTLARRSLNSTHLNLNPLPAIMDHSLHLPVLYCVDSKEEVG